MTFVPEDFQPPTVPATEEFRLEPLGPQHNDSDLAAWMSSVEHIRETPGFPNWDWPPLDGMTSDRNLQDLVQHAADFVDRKGFTFTVLDPAAGDVIGCVYIYPTVEEGFAAGVRSWVRADHAHLDAPLADSVDRWLTEAWPWQRVYRYGR